MIYLSVLIVFSYIVNDGNRTEENIANKRYRYESMIVFILIVLNKILDPSEMEWSSWSFIILFGVLAFLESNNFINLKDKSQ